MRKDNHTIQKTSEDILKRKKKKEKRQSLRYLHAHLHSMFFNAITKCGGNPRVPRWMKG